MTSKFLKMYNIGSAFALIGLVAGLSPIANAVSISTEYEASEANDHVIWLPNISPGFRYNTAINLSFTEFDDGTAILLGKADNAGNGFDISVEFGGRLNPGDIGWAPSGSPKYEGNSTLRAFQALNVDDWSYYTQTNGTIEGYGSYFGDKYFLGRLGPAFQIGFGANLKNTDFGAAGWLSVYESTPTGEKGRKLRRHGDFNISLNRVPDSGTTIALLATALCGVFVLRRRFSERSKS